MLVAVVSVAIIIVMLKQQHPATKKGEIENKSVKRKNKEKQAILQICLIVGSFMIGYIPFTGISKSHNFHSFGTEPTNTSAPSSGYFFSQ